MTFHIPPFRRREIGWASLPTGSPSSSAGAAAWEEVLGRASSRSACPLWPRCQRGREGAEKAKQEKRSQSHGASARAKDMKSTWSLQEEKRRRVRPSPKRRREKKKVNKNHRVWLAGQRAGAVTWTVDYMSCHLAVGFWAAGGTSLGRRNEVNTYVLSLLVLQIYVQLGFRYSESAFGANVFKASPSDWPGKPFVSSWRYSRVVHVPQFPYISRHPACL